MTMSIAGMSIEKRGLRDRTLRRLSGAARVMAVTALACLLLACASRGPLLPAQPHTDHRVPPGEHRTVALLGATGMVGGYLLEEALSRGYGVRALARTPAKLDKFKDRITVIQGDALDPAVIRELLRGSDVVVSALGPVKTDGETSRFISANVTRNVLQAMQGKQVSQYLVVSGAAVVMPGDDRNFLGWWIRTLVQVGLRGTLQDKQAEYELLSGSAADWMLVRCPLIDAEAFRRDPMVSLQTPPAFRLRAGELAHFMFDQIDARQFTRQGPLLGSD